MASKSSVNYQKQKVEPFVLKFLYNYRNYNLRVEQIYLDERIEKFKIGSFKKNMIIQTNRPFFRNKGLMHRRPDIDFITKDFYRGSHINKLIEAIISAADLQNDNH